MDKGWVKLHRKIEENVLLNTNNSAYILFTKLLTYANSKGEYITGRFKLAERCNLNPNTVYKTLTRLCEDELVTLESNNRFTVIRICNWKHYQAVGTSKTNSQVTAKYQPGNSQVTLYKNKKENKNIGIDLELAKKEQAAKQRTGASPGYLNAKAIAEELKRRRLS